MTTRKLAARPVEQPVRFADGPRQVWQVLKHMDGNHPVEEAVGKVEALLTIAYHGLHAGKRLANRRRHVFAEVIGVIVLLLLRRELLVVDVLAEAGADLERGG